MNLTPLLDLIIILFFAQSLLLSDRSQRVEKEADQVVAQIQEELRENDELREREIAEREQRITELEGTLERRLDEQERIRNDLVEREKAYVTAFDEMIDTERFLELVRGSYDVDDPNAPQIDPVASELDPAERRRAAERFAQSYVVMRKTADALESHVTVWVFYICYDDETGRYDLEFQSNGELVELSNEAWDFASRERLYNRLVRELTANGNLTTPPGPVFPMWGTKGDVAKWVRDAFRDVLPSALLEVNTIYTNDPTVGGKGWPNVKIHSGSIAPLGNIPIVSPE